MIEPSPGPWFLAAPSSDDEWAIVYATDGGEPRPICGLITNGNDPERMIDEPDEVDKANGALIIAAPKMLHLLPKILCTLQETDAVLLELAQYVSDDQQEMARAMALRVTNLLADALELFTAVPEAGL